MRSTERHVVVSVHDEGPGIPHHLQRQLAEPLLRALRGRRSSALPELILVVDDEEDLRSLVEFVLGAAGFRVRTAADGREALECVLEEMPALIFLDMRMPGMDGWAFAREFRARYGRVCPIVVTTAAESARARAREIDADAWLAKPFDVEDVIRAAEHHLAGSASSAPARD